MKEHLEPLAIAANITQATHCRLDEVLITFGFLYYKYKTLSMAQNNEALDSILKSLENRWEKADQGVFIAAVILNPLHMVLPFSRTHLAFTKAAIYSLLSSLWVRFFTEKPPLNLYTQLMGYLEKTGEYEDLMKWAGILKALAHTRVILN